MALFFTILCGAAAIILGYFSYYFSRGHFVHSTEAIIDAEIRHAVEWDDSAKLQSAFDNSSLNKYLLLGSDGRKLAGNLDKLPDSVSILAEGLLTFEFNGKTFAARIHSFPDGRKLLVGVDISEVSADFAFMKWLSILSIVFIIIVIAASYLISTFVVTRTNRIATTAKEIMDTGDLSRRIDVQSRWDDLSYMTGILNELLGRIEELMQGIRQVSDNIAHDLRTPLTRLRHNLEFLSQQENIQNDQECSKICENLIEETEHLLTTFNALLRISRIETGKQHSAFQQVDLKALIQDTLDLYEPLAEQKNIKLTANLHPSSCRGDRNLLFQAIANLLDNAIKFTPENGSIAINLNSSNSGHQILISDSGPGIAEQDMDKVFDRFYRAEQSRHTPGSGLGLSLVEAAVLLHKGSIYLKNLNSGLQVRIEL